MSKVVVVGSSGHARVVLDLLEKEGEHRVVGLIDRFRRPGEETLGYPVLGGEEVLPGLVARGAVEAGLVAIGDNWARGQVSLALSALVPGFRLITAVHPRACVARDVSLGDGTVVLAGAVVGPCCRVGRGCVLNTNASLDHDSRLGDFASLGPRAVTGGYVRVGAYSAVGIGAVVVENVSIGEETVIGAGATVLRDVAANVVAYGTPARAVRGRAASDPYLRPVPPSGRLPDALCPVPTSPPVLALDPEGVRAAGALP
ncbi:MAG TPA: acetyltransferase [Gemmataceae bacterium]|nr:acetyltransferase [Gemmataceae bacterium]